MRDTGHVYAVYDTKAGLAKIGHTRNLRGRFSTLGVHAHDHIKVVFTLEAKFHQARLLEKLAQECIANARRRQVGRSGATEWFEVPVKHVQMLGSMLVQFMQLLEDRELLGLGDAGRFIVAATEAARDARARVIRG